MARFNLFFIILCTLILTASLAGAEVQAPGDMVIAPPQGMTASKSPVDFSHARHADAQVQCITCHHNWDGTSEIKACASAGCHDQPGKKETASFYTAFHSRKSDASCLGCHKIVKKEGKPVPVSCKQCHK